MSSILTHRPRPATRSSLEPLEARIAPATITVTTLDDTVAADGFVSLREAIMAANTNAPVNEAPAGDLADDHIGFDPALFGSIPLASVLTITDDVTIDGSVADGHIIIDGQGTTRIFQANSFLALEHLTLANGKTSSSSDGAALTVSAQTVTLDDVHIQDSVGSAIFAVGGIVGINHSSFTGNAAVATGGALFNVGSTITIQDSTFSDNSSSTTGGAIENGGNLELVRVDFDHNSALTGGAIHNTGNLTYSSGLVSDNEGGGLFNYSSGVTTLNYVDFTANHGEVGGALQNFGGTVEIHGSIISDNVADQGGGIANLNGGILTITDTEFVDNQAPEGAAIYNSDGGAVANLVTLTGSVVHGNGAALGDPMNPTAGGGYWGSGNLKVINSTFAENSADTGGNLYTESGTVLLHNSTIADGHATTDAGGLFHNGGTVSLFSTILGRNDLADVSISATPANPTTLNVSSSLIQTLTGTIDGTDSNNLVGVDPNLGYLGDHGGFLPSISLQSGSPAIDHGSNELALATDQRGAPFDRTQGAGIDIGSFEASDATMTIAANGKKATYRDVDGDLVTISTSAGTFDQSNFILISEGLGARLFVLDLSGQSEFAGANISVKAKRAAHGDGFANVSHFDAFDIDLGRVTIDGDLTSLHVGDSNTATPGLLGLNVVSMGEFDSHGHVEVVGALNALKVRTDLTNTEISVTGGTNGNLGSVKITGSTLATSFDVEGSIKSVTVFANFLYSSIIVDGSIGSFVTTAVPGKFRASGGIVVKGSVIGGDIGTNGDLANLRVSGEFQGTRVTARGDLAPADLLTAQTIGNLAIGGRVMDSDFLVGFDLDLNAVNPDVQVDKVAITGNWIASNLAVGVEEGADGYFGFQTDDAIAGGGSPAIVSRIASLTLKGHSYGTPGESDDFYGIAVEEIGKARIGLANLPLTAGASNDLAPAFFGSGFDFVIHEVTSGV